MAGQRFFYNVTQSLGAYAQKDKIGIGALGGPPAVLNQFAGFNPTANPGFIQVFDVLLPADLAPGDEPVLSFEVGALGSFAFVDPLAGLKFSIGLVWAVSTTGDVYTASGDAWWVLAQGRFV